MSQRCCELVQALVIGGGVVGCALLFALAQRGVEAVLVEAELDVGEGTSKANSAIVHTGFDARPGTVEAALLRRAAALWPRTVEALGVPYLAVGALMVARSAEEQERLASEIAANAAALGVPTEPIDGAALRQVAPFVTDQARAALAIPGEAVIDPFWLTRAYAGAAMSLGARLMLGQAVVSLAVGDEAVLVQLADGTRLLAQQVFNCAGLHSDEVARLAGDSSFTIRPRKGQLLVSEETFGVDRIVLPLPGRQSKGMLVTPIVFGGLLLGPTAEDQQDKADRSVTPEARQRILAACRQLVPAVAEMVPIRQFAGVRTVSSTGDYILRPSTAGDRLFHVAGMRSTGVSASPAIAEFVAEWAARRRGWPAASTRTYSLPAADLPMPAGEVVCLCRSVSRGEILAACAGQVPPATLDALKRRCGVGFGDCQGNLCTVPALLVAAAAWERPPERALKHQPGAWLFAGRTATGPAVRPAQPAARPAQPDTPRAMVIVGGGLAGIGVALSLCAAGQRPLLVERAGLGGALRGCLRTVSTRQEQEALERLHQHLAAGQAEVWLGATAVGLLPAANGWRVVLQDALGIAELVARQVVIASGGYVQPREHLPIAGPRGSGVITADLAHAALDHGLLPGQVAVVVGNGRYARGTAARLRAAGLELGAELDWEEGRLPVDEVRGEQRLQAVRVGERWLEADTLVLAHRLLPAAFLLRGSGLVDGRPDRPVPADADGATPLAGVWAVGSCVRPDIDHRDSLVAGLELGARLAAQGGPL